jgi:hypothetical protein
MTLQELERVAPKYKVEYGPGEAFVGNHQVRRGSTRLWFQFEQGLHLRSYVLQRREGSHWRLSSREDVCTGELSFRLRLHPGASELLKANVYLDGKPVGILESVSDLILMAGEHELRIDSKAHPSLIYRFKLGPTDRGDQLVGIDLVSEGDEKRVAVRPVSLR